jgi:hypothetical protein
VPPKTGARKSAPVQKIEGLDEVPIRIWLTKAADKVYKILTMANVYQQSRSQFGF